MLLIYTHKITPRLSYVFKHICTRVLGLEITFTTVVEDFIAHQGLKMSYTRQPLGKELFVQSHHLLFEEGISDVDIIVTNWKHTKGFFKIGEKSNLPYDIFAASFYLLSRYEEYLPYVSDDFGRYPPEESVAYKHHFLKQPIIDIWAYEFKSVILEFYPEHQFKKRVFKFKPIIDVPVAYQYLHKGLVRTVGGIVKDILVLKFHRLYERFSVLFKLRKDPFDTYKWLINNHRKRELNPVFLFLLGDYTTYDKSISHNNKSFISLIKSISDYFDVGLKGSFEALDNKETLKEEKKRFETIFNIPLAHSRNSFSKLKLPVVYRNLIDMEITHDYTMGYVSEIGFRAGTCTPFYFYDLDYEMQTPLKIVPFCVLDYVYINANIDSAYNSIHKIMQAVKNVNGSFNMVVHNYTFSESETWKGWRKLYIKLLEQIDDK